MQWSKFKHPAWSWVLSLLSAFGATLSPQPLRVLCLAGVFLFAIYATFNSFAERRVIKVVLPAVLYFGFCVGLYLVANKWDEKQTVHSVAGTPQSPEPQRQKTESSTQPSSAEVAKGLPNSPSTSTPQRAYDLTGRRKQRFLNLLDVQAEPRDTLRVGCIAWSDASCVAAGQFLLLLSEAGWTIDSNKVFRAEPSIPRSGMSLVSHNENMENTLNIPPHLGVWNAMAPSEVTIVRAFNTMGIQVTPSSSQDMPSGMLGVYFGPEPSLILNSKQYIRDQLGIFRLQVSFIESAQWKREVLVFLENCGLNPSFGNRWRGSNPDIAQRLKVLDAFISELK